jgi:hypothetical protein
MEGHDNRSIGSPILGRVVVSLFNWLSCVSVSVDQMQTAEVCGQRTACKHVEIDSPPSHAVERCLHLITSDNKVELAHRFDTVVALQSAPD